MTITDPDLLMSVMEAREEVEEAGSDRAALQPLLDRMLGLEAGCVQVRMGWMRGSLEAGSEELELGSWLCGRCYAARGGLQACVQRCLGRDVVAEHTPVWLLHCKRLWSPTALGMAAPSVLPLPLGPAADLWPRPVPPPHHLPQELAQAFAAGDLSHAAELTTQLRYICRIKEAILDKM